MKRILITGGAGFLGTCLSYALASRNYIVTILDNFSEQVHAPKDVQREIHLLSQYCTLLRGDIRQPADCARALADQDAVIHLAAETGTGQSMYEITRYVDVNMGGTAVLLEEIKRRGHQVKKLILASSRAIYGEGKYFCSRDGIVYPSHRSPKNLSSGDFEMRCPYCNDPLTPRATDEQAISSPTSVYAVTKLGQEQMLNVSHAHLGVSVVVLRFQNIYGPGQSLGNPYTGILAVFATRIRNGNPIEIFEDGLESRDMIYVEDAARAVILTLETAASSYSVFNVGTGTRINVLAIADMLKKQMHSQSAVHLSGRYRIGDIRHNFADIGKIQKELSYQPEVAFEHGLKKFVDWVQLQPLPLDQFADSIKTLEKHGLYT